MNAAVFVDFENLHRALGAEPGTDDLRKRELSLDVLDGLLMRLRENGHAMVLGRSYAAFDVYPGAEVAHDLALLGLDPQYVLVSHSGKNSADVQLTFDVARVLFRRDDIEMIVVVSGDRDFLPLARQVLEEGRELRVVSIGHATSGDLRERVGENRFWNALDLVEEREDRLHRGHAATTPPATDEVDVDVDEAGPAAFSDVPAREPQRPSAVRPRREAHGLEPGTAVVVGHIPVTWEAPTSTEGHEAMLYECLELMMRSRLRHGSREIWLSPFLKGPMSQHFAHIVHPERRALVNELRARGVIRVEERENLYADHPYSVIVIEDEHPMAKSSWARVKPT